jgi:hypothetical protein
MNLAVFQSTDWRNPWRLPRRYAAEEGSPSEKPLCAAAESSPSEKLW